MEISNRHVLITGASKGVGKAFAKTCAEDQAHVHIVLRKDDEDLVQTLKKAGAKSVNVYKADLSSREGLEALIGQIKDVPVEILFNNASVAIDGLLEEQSLDDILHMLEVNIHALIHLSHRVLPGMLERKRGKIINNSHVAAFMHLPNASTFAASKAAVAAFTDCLRLELKETGVTTLLLLTSETINSAKYVQMIREAVLHDLEVVEPSGFAGVGLKIAKFAKPLFEFEASRRFKRKY